MEQVVRFLFKYREALYSKSQFGFGARPSVLLILALIAGIGALIYVIYASSSVRLSPAWRASLITLRVVLITLFIFCLMRPVIVVPSIVPQSSYVAVLMDDSSSMNLADEANRSRLDSVKHLMSGDAKFYKALADNFKVRAFKFSSTAERVQDAAELSGAGEQTDLVQALEQATRESAGLPVSGIILMSDGSSNASGDLSANLSATLNNLRARGLPVFAVGLGPTKLDGDVELVRATAPRRVLAGSPVTCELLVRAGEQKSVKVDLIEDSHLLRSQQIPVQADATTVARITFTPSSPGLHRYTLLAVASPDEPVPDNNSQEIVIDVVDAKPKVLYIEGEPRWEYGKLREAASGEKNLILTSVLRSADGKFYRQGIDNPDELVTGFPKSEEELFKYDAIIIGSVEATFFTFDQLKAIEQFVSRRGGTLLALGGPKAFNAGGYGNTPIADLLPIYLNGANVAGESQAFKAAPADRGRDHPAARLEDQPELNAKAWEKMPAITLPEVIGEMKPGATVILEARGTRDRNRTTPLLVEERYGRGRTLALLASDTWRWRMMLESKDTSFETFWRNFLRYLVEAVRHPVEATTDRAFYGTREQVRIRAEVADEKFININDAMVSARITSASGRTVDLPLKQTIDGGFEGYAAEFHPDEDGLYKVEVTSRRSSVSKQGPALSSATTSFITGPLNREARDAAQNRELLKRIASETSGQYYTPSQTDNLVEDLTHREGTGSVRMTYDLWDMPINFLLVMGIAAGEWFIRKRKGLA